MADGRETDAATLAERIRTVASGPMSGTDFAEVATLAARGRDAAPETRARVAREQRSVMLPLGIISAVMIVGLLSFVAFADWQGQEVYRVTSLILCLPLAAVVRMAVLVTRDAQATS